MSLKVIKRLVLSDEIQPLFNTAVPFLLVLSLPCYLCRSIKFNDLAGASSPHWDGKNAYDRRPYDKQSVFCQNGSKISARNLRGICKLAMNTAGGTIKKMVCTG